MSSGNLAELSARFFDCFDIGRGFDQSRYGRRLEVCAGAAGYVVEHDRKLDRFGDGLKVLELFLLGVGRL